MLLSGKKLVQLVFISGNVGGGEKGAILEERITESELHHTSNFLKTQPLVVEPIVIRKLRLTTASEKVRHPS